MLRLGGDHSFNPHVYLAEKSDICVDALEAMTDRDSDDLLSPPGSFSLKRHNQQPPNGHSTGRNSGTPTDFGNAAMYSQPHQQYHRPEVPILPKQHRVLSTANNSWQPLDSQRNPYGPPLSNPRASLPGCVRLHPEAGEFEPGRGVVDYGINSAMNPKQRLDVYRNQQTGNALPQAYGYRAKPQQYEQSYFSGNPMSRSQNLQTYPPTSRAPQQPTRSSGSSRYELQADTPYGGDLPSRASYGISNRVSYNSGPFYHPTGRESWDRASLSQFESELSQTPSLIGGANTTPNRLGSRAFAYNYDADNARSRPTSLSGRADSSDLGLEFDTDRQSFLFPSDYDPGSQSSYSIPDYDLLRDAAFANTDQPLNNGGFLDDQRYGERDESYGDSKMLSYFLRDSAR
jgi:hypothetical protein